MLLYSKALYARSHLPIVSYSGYTVCDYWLHKYYKSLILQNAFAFMLPRYAVLLTNLLLTSLDVFSSSYNIVYTQVRNPCKY